MKFAIPVAEGNSRAQHTRELEKQNTAPPRKRTSATGHIATWVGRAISAMRLGMPSSGRKVQSADCLFCKQNRPDLNQIMSENKTFYARYDNFPATEGHVEVVPKRHVESFFDLTPKELKDAYRLILAVQVELSEQHDPDGYTIGINEGKAAGRTIDHLHIHLIPRRFGDVKDPRGGIRRAVPNWAPDQWKASTDSSEPSNEQLASRDHR